MHSCRNVTDVDDVLLEAARTPGRHYDELALLQEADFDRSMTALRVATPTHRPRSRHHVGDVVQLATTLLAAGAAYEADGTVWFRGADVAASTGLPREELLALAAAYGDAPDDPGKTDPLDVAVWRPSAEGQPAWPSPWGWGRPGWHAECAAMAMAAQGASIDVLVGGADLGLPPPRPPGRHGAGRRPASRRSPARCSTSARSGSPEPRWPSRRATSSSSTSCSRRGRPRRCACCSSTVGPVDPWSWEPGLLDAAEERLERLYAAAGRRTGTSAGAAAVLERLRDDLDVPGALAVAEEQGGETARGALRLLRLA